MVDNYILISGHTLDKISHKSQDDVQVIRKADLENHNKDGGLWIIIHGKVYDVHDFKSQAQCGWERLTEYAGQDATAAFENAHHSLEAREMLQAFYVGQYVEVRVFSMHIWRDDAKIFHLFAFVYASWTMLLIELI